MNYPNKANRTYNKVTNYSNKGMALEDDLNDAEYAYYLEVLNRCNGKMIKALN